MARTDRQVDRHVHGGPGQGPDPRVARHGGGALPERQELLPDGLVGRGRERPGEAGQELLLAARAVERERGPVDVEDPDPGDAVADRLRVLGEVAREIDHAQRPQLVEPRAHTGEVLLEERHRRVLEHQPEPLLAGAEGLHRQLALGRLGRERPVGGLQGRGPVADLVLEALLAVTEGRLGLLQLPEDEVEGGAEPGHQQRPVHEVVGRELQDVAAHVDGVVHGPPRREGELRRHRAGDGGAEQRQHLRVERPPVAEQRYFAMAGQTMGQYHPRLQPDAEEPPRSRPASSLAPGSGGPAGAAGLPDPPRLTPSGARRTPRPAPRCGRRRATSPRASGSARG